MVIVLVIYVMLVRPILVWLNNHIHATSVDLRQNKVPILSGSDRVVLCVVDPPLGSDVLWGLDFNILLIVVSKATNMIL